MSEAVLTSPPKPPLTLPQTPPPSFPLPSKFATPIVQLGEINQNQITSNFNCQLFSRGEAAAATFKVETIEFAEF